MQSRCFQSSDGSLQITGKLKLINSFFDVSFIIQTFYEDLKIQTMDNVVSPRLV